MLNSSNNTRSKKFGVGLVITAMILGFAGVLAAQDGPSGECSGDPVAFGTLFFGVEDGGNRLLSTAPTSREYSLPEPMPAGTYDLNAVSYDGYESRDTTVPQRQEQWYAQFLDAEGSVLATSGTTDDLIDSVIEDSWSGSIGSIKLDDTATSIRLVHAAPGSESVNSVRPVCLGITGGPETPITTTTVDPETPTTTTVDPETPTTTTVDPEIPTTTTTVNDGDPVPPSTLTVNFTSPGPDSSIIRITCGDRVESVIGTTVSLFMGDLPGGESCTAQYPSDLDCSVDVDPVSTLGASSAGVQNVLFPAEGNVDAVVTIHCVGDQLVTTTTTTTTTTPATEVAGIVEEAPVATPQAGQPTFTG